MALPLGDRASRRWLAKSGNRYAAEIDEIARHLGRSGAHVLNVCFEWGCTGGAWDTPQGPLLRRVLDWPFPRLGELVVVAHQDGPAGDFFNITWPGANGSFHGMARGRFAAAINQAPMRRHGAGYAGDWFANRLRAGRQTGWPAAHLLRHVFETARNFAEAKQLLCETPLAVPAIFILSGIVKDEGCVIERTEEAFAVRAMEAGRVCAANHFETCLAGGRWQARPIDSAGRAACARALRGGGQTFSWFAAPIANANSRLVFEAGAAEGSLAVMGVQGCSAVTDVFRFSKTSLPADWKAN
ncbi:MAG TPA: carcinine hydrolase/isopenicillin-N N-acyltransferase family protein [Rhizomicrobium sp.]|nr:carcinine hydrolase/isopenicillin-N N-acyltransferase family protein [Rhizomicrobium sp.]